MQLNASRLRARTDDTGNLLRLARAKSIAPWDQQLIAQGIASLSRATAGDTVSAYHLEAAISACHCLAADDASTDWPRILGLYDQLVANKIASPIVAMNRAVAVARVLGPEQGLKALAAIADRSTLEAYHLYHAICGTFAAELGRTAEALTHFKQAGNLATLPAEREFIARRVEEVTRKRELS